MKYSDLQRRGALPPAPKKAVCVLALIARALTRRGRRAGATADQVLLSVLEAVETIKIDLSRSFCTIFAPFQVVNGT